ncbi:MAG: DDE-type integrase/transposase/recombinase [Desulfobacteraceae bacterium]|nr:DDE-type integrase/transposase/recombinase [Desulfobacteraceae bacterium]
MKKKEEKWAVFWCDLLGPIIYEEIEADSVRQYLGELASRAVVFPNGRVKKPSLSTLKRKLKRYKTGGFKALGRKARNDRGKSRIAADEIISAIIELKKDQPLRSPKAINRFLKERYGLTLPRSTIYWHLKQAGATRKKLGVVKTKVRGRWTRNHTHSLWVGDFADGPYVIEKDNVVPTCLSAFIDCHSRFVVEARYYFRQNLDVLIDSLIRALAKHGAPLALYLDNAKVYHSHGLKMACHMMHTRLIHRPERDPAPGGIVERFIQTAQNQFEAEVRAGDILTLERLNRAFSAWLSAGYHKDPHSELGVAPENQFQNGFRVTRQVDMKEILSAFMQRIPRTVNRTFSDVQLNKRYYRVAPELRGDRVEVGFDPFSAVDTVEIRSLTGEYLGLGKQHFREPVRSPTPAMTPKKTEHNYLDLLVRQHEKGLDAQTKGIDYRKVQNRPWPFHEFAAMFAKLLGNRGGLASFTADELETLKKAYNTSARIDRKILRQSFENACPKSMPYVIRELKLLLNQRKEN